MRFRFGRIAENPDFAPERSGWRRLREPPVWAVSIGGGLIGIMVAIGIGFLWVSTTRAFEFSKGPVPLSHVLGQFGLGVAGIFGVIGVHELLHATAHPGHGRTRDSVLGFWPRALIFYAHYDGPMSRNRFLVVLLTPFAVLSIGPLLAGVLLRLDSTLLAGCSVLNSALAGADLLGVMLVWVQVPARAVIQNQGWWTWWHPLPHDEVTAVPDRDGKS